MNNKVYGILIFALGAAVGALSSFQYAKRRYEQIAREEIGSVKAVYSRKEQALQEKVTDAAKVYDHIRAQLDKDKNDNPVASDILKTFANMLEPGGELFPRVPKERSTFAGEKPDLNELAKQIAQENGYTHYGTEHVDIPQKPDLRPYVIPPEEFGDFDDYEQVSLTYYADGTLADENDEIVDDVDDTVGQGSLGRFGEYEDDSVFVRNDARKCDYEILFDHRNYDDVARLRQVEVR